MSKFVGKVLVVDDDEALREIEKMFFDFQGWEVAEAHNGLAAQTYVDTHPVDLIVSDVRMPIVDGLEFLEHVKKNHPHIKFILTTGFSEVLETIDAHKKGADNFIAKPFNSKQLAEVVEATLNPPKEESGPAATAEKSEFIDLPISDFFSSSNLLSDIYIKLSEKKRLLIAKKGEPVPKERMGTYQEKGVKFLSIKREDFPGYVQFNLKLASALKTTNKVSANAKKHQLSHTVEVLITDSFLGEVDKDLLLSSKEVVLGLIDNLLDNEDYTSLIEQMKEHSPLLLSHSMGVSLYSVVVAEKLGWTSLRNKGMLAMGGLYHDIGKKELPPELLEKPRSRFNREELQMWEMHPARGRAILDDIKGIPSEVVQIVAHHHNANNEGSLEAGYSKSGGGHPLADLVGLVDRFCNYCLKGAGETISPEQAFQKILDYHMDEVKPEYLVALMAAFDYEAPKELQDRKQNAKAI